MWLRYRNGGGAWTTQFIDEIRNQRIPVANRRSGPTLRGRIYDKKIDARYDYFVTISADQTWGSSNTIRTFLESFFIADERALNLQVASSPTPTTDWIDVKVEGGDMPVELLEGHRYLPEYTFRLTSKEPI